MAKTLSYRIGTGKAAVAARRKKANGAAGADLWNQQVAEMKGPDIPERKEIPLLAAMGYKAVQFEVGWPSVMHADGTPDKGGIERCRALVAEIRAYGLLPIVTVTRWQRPLWVKIRGRWVNVKSEAAFQAYMGLLHAQFGKDAVIRTVHREPWDASARELMLRRASSDAAGQGESLAGGDWMTSGPAIDAGSYALRT